MQPLEYVGEHKHGCGRQPRKYGLPISEGGEHGIGVAVRDGRASIHDAKRLATEVGIGGASGLVDQTPFVAEVREGGVLHVDEILEDVVDPGGIEPPGEIRTAHHVASRAVDPISGPQTSRAEESLRNGTGTGTGTTTLRFSTRGRGATGIGRSNQLFCFELGRGVV